MIRYLTVGDLLAVAEQVSDELLVRDYGLLDAAAARPAASAFGEDAYPTLEEKAAALLHSLIRNHPFVDGNKRAGWVAAKLFLATNGQRLAAGEDAVFNFVVAIAEGRFDDVPEIAKQLRAWTRPVAK